MLHILKYRFHIYVPRIWFKKNKEVFQLPSSTLQSSLLRQQIGDYNLSCDIFLSFTKFPLGKKKKLRYFFRVCVFFLPKGQLLINISWKSQDLFSSISKKVRECEQYVLGLLPSTKLSDKTKRKKEGQPQKLECCRYILHQIYLFGFSFVSTAKLHVILNTQYFPISYFIGKLPCNNIASTYWFYPWFST